MGTHKLGNPIKAYRRDTRISSIFLRSTLSIQRLTESSQWIIMDVIEDK
jgi:hypothetical protein